MLLKPSGIVAAAAGGIVEPATALDFGTGNAERYYDLGSFALPVPFCIGLLLRVEDNIGASFQYALSAGTFDAANSCQIYIGESSSPNAGDRNVWQGRAKDAAGDAANLLGGAMAIDGQKRLVLFQYDGSTAQLYRVVAGQAAFLDASASTALVNAFTPSTNWRLGGRADGNVDRFFEEHIKRVFFGGRVLTTVEMEAIAAETQTPSGVLGANAVRNWLFTTAAATVLDEVGGHAATRQGANWPAAVEW